MQTKRLYLLGAVGGVAILGLAVWMATDGGGVGGGSPANPNDPDQVARGGAIYAEACASCHQADLKGEPNWRQPKADGTLPAPPHDDSGHTWHHGDHFLFGYTKFGGKAYAPEGFQSAMPGFEASLSDADIWAVLAFIKSKWSPEARAQQERISAQSL